MTPERLAEIRDRLEKASPGPWACWNGYPLADQVGEKYGMHGINRIGPEYSGEDGQLGLHGGWSNDGDLFATKADAEFVATSHAAITDLLAEVDRLQQVVAEAQAALKPQSNRDHTPAGRVDRIVRTRLILELHS